MAKTAIERARRGEGPTLIEAETYRFRGHSLADPDELRLKSEKEAYAVSPHAESLTSEIDMDIQTMPKTSSSTYLCKLTA